MKRTKADTDVLSWTELRRELARERRARQLYERVLHALATEAVTAADREFALGKLRAGKRILQRK